MKRFKRLSLWLVIGAVLAGLAAYVLHRFETVPRLPRGVELMPTLSYKLSKSEIGELQIMKLNLRHGDGLAWKAALKRDLLIKANWLANRLNLPMRRPIGTNIQECLAPIPWDLVLVQYPTERPDTVFGADIYNTNFLRLKRILSLKFGLKGSLVTPPFSFAFIDGQCWNIARLTPDESGRYAERYVTHFIETRPSAAETAQAYQSATNWLAEMDVNLDLLEKSRLAHPVHEGTYQPEDASPPQTIYYVDWGTNYYANYYIYKTWHTNEWHSAVSVKIGPHQELLEIYVGDLTYFRNPPMLIPSKTVWRLLHTPDPSYAYLQTPAGMREFIMTPEDLSQYDSGNTNGVPNRLWLYQHHQLDPVSTLLISNDLKKLNSELIPYAPSP